MPQKDIITFIHLVSTTALTYIFLIANYSSRISNILEDLSRVSTARLVWTQKEGLTTNSSLNSVWSVVSAARDVAKRIGTIKNLSS